MKVTQNDLLDALREALAKPGDGEGFTAGELAEAMGCRVLRVRLLLKSLAAQGRLDVTKTRRTGIDGRLALVPAYRIKAA